MTWPRPLIALALIVTSLAVPSCASAAGTCPGQNGKIVAGSSNGLGLFGQGGGVRWLVRGRDGTASYTSTPSFSCDGKLVAYVGDDETTCPPMEVVSVATDKRRLFQYGRYRQSGFPAGGCGSAPSFLLGRRLLFGVRPRNGRFQGTFVASDEGRHRHRMFGFGVCANTADGRWLVSCYARRLVLRNARGRVVRPLTPPTKSRPVYYLTASISADGRWIVYAKTLDTPEGGTYDRSDVYVVRRDGTHRRRLTDDGQSFDPTFSPDGRWIAFLRGGEVERHELLVMPLAHPGRARILARVASSLRAVDWGPR
jgi:hypothetical protein